MGAVRDLVNELRNRGVYVHEWDGWDGRGNENVRQINPKGAILHHTGSKYGFAYPELVSSTRPGLQGGVLANFAGNSDGSLTVLASGLAWHAGGGYGPDQGPLAPYANNRNYYTVGLEIVYPGKSPMTEGQYITAKKFAKTVADMFAGGDLEYVRGHYEVNGYGYEGKWDPGYAPGLPIDMNRLRQEAYNAFEEPQMELSDTMLVFEDYDNPTKEYTLRDVLYGIHKHAKIGEWRTATLERELAELRVIVEGLSTGTGYTLDQVAEAVINKLDKRLDS